jgi:aryl-alcohol dehydrogenase-like predicted oxidoreductase
LATKAGRYGLDIESFDFSATRIRASLEESLARLGVESLDLFQLHDIEFASMETIIEESIPTMQALKKEGKIRFWGVTGLPLGVFTHVLNHATPDTILSYCRYALNDDGLSALLPDLAARGVGVINASPTGMGLLTERGSPEWHPASSTIKEGCRRAVEFCASREVDITKLALQFATSNPAIASTLVGTASVANIENNVRWVSEPMDYDLLAEVREVLHPIQGMTWPEGRPENNLL